MPDTPTIVDNDIPGQTPIKPLKPREIAFVQGYANPASTTFGNATQSYASCHPNASIETARREGWETLTRPHIAQSVIETINNAGLGVEVRADSIRRIISHKDIGRVVSRVKRNEEDGTVETVTESGPSHVATLKAIEVLNKMDGTYERGRVAADVARDEYRDLRKRFFTSQAPKAPQARTTVPRIDDKGEAGTAAPPMVAGQVDMRRRGRPRKPPAQAPGGGLSTRPYNVVSPLPKADEFSTGGGI